jgi:hypothetical protein
MAAPRRAPRWEEDKPCDLAAVIEWLDPQSVNPAYREWLKAGCSDKRTARFDILGKGGTRIYQLCAAHSQAFNGAPTPE